MTIVHISTICALVCLLNTNLRHAPLAMSAVCPTIAHGRSIHWLFHVGFLIATIITILRSSGIWSCTLLEAFSHVRCIESAREGPFLTKRRVRHGLWHIFIRRNARRIQVTVAVRGVGGSRHGCRERVRWRLIRGRDRFASVSRYRNGSLQRSDGVTAGNVDRCGCRRRSIMPWTLQWL